MFAVFAHNNSTPSIDSGVELLTYSLEAGVGNIVEVEALMPYVELTSGSTGPFTAAIFVDDLPISVITDRITTGGSSGNSVLLKGTFVMSSATQTITLRVGMNTSGTTLNFNSKFNGNAKPRFLIRTYAI
jgi:hypothetical protein